MPTAAWIVAVDLPAVARRLSRTTTHHQDELDAVAHLTRSHAGEPSPLRQTLEWALFYTEVDPSLLLEANETIYAKEIEPTRYPGRITGVNAEGDEGDVE